MRKNSPLHNILLIEDNQEHVCLIEDTLNSSDIKYQIRVVRSGDDCLAQLRQEKYELILLDYFLPKTNGMEILKQLKLKYPNIPVVVVTGRGDENVAVEAMKLGAFDYIVKRASQDYLINLKLTARKGIDKYKADNEKLKLERQLKKATLRLKRLAITDGLTGVYNHRYFHQRLSEEFYRAQRQRDSLCCIMLDVDHFKKFNDTYGHQAGDKILKAIARIIKESIRRIDLLARYGGDEFIIYLPQTGIERGSLIAQRLRKKVENCGLSTPYGEFKPTISLGVAVFPDSNVETEQDLVRKADIALYQSKHRGRNRVQISLPKHNRGDETQIEAGSKP